jgi:NTE family protein
MLIRDSEAIAPRWRQRVAAAVLLLGLATAGLAAAECAPSSMAPDEPMALVLSGGGAKGAYEAGVAATFIRAGLPIELVAGSSAGALNAAMVADGRVDLLEQLWRRLTRDRVYTLRPAIFFAGLLPGWLTLWSVDRAGSLFDPQPLRDLIAGTIDLDRIRASRVHLLVVTSDLARRQRRLFDNRTVTADALMASAAMPGAFPAVEVDGAMLSDAGLVGRAPILETIESGVPVRRVVVVVSYAADERGRTSMTMRNAVADAFEMSMIYQIERDAELARLKYPEVAIELFTPSAPLLVGPLDFHPDALAALVERGEADAHACLRGWAGQR